MIGTGIGVGTAPPATTGGGSPPANVITARDGSDMTDRAGNYITAR